METQESFAAYVGARWAMLYRLAVLLVGEDAAADLTQDALVRALRSWDRVQEEAQPDAYVKRLLVTAMLSERTSRKDLGSDDSAPEHVLRDREELWSRISSLAPRQRAVVVLRFHEGLSESEIAGVLGCSPGAVAADGSAAMTGLGEDDVRWVLRSEAEDARVPAAPVEDLFAAAARERRTGRWRAFAVGAGLVAAATVVTVLVAAGGEPEKADRAPSAPVSTMPVPSRLTDLSVGPKPAVLYATRDKLHLGDRTVTLPDRAAGDLLQAGDLALVDDGTGRIGMVDMASATDGSVAQVRDFDTRAASRVQVDPAGRWAAWTRETYGGAIVVRLQSLEAPYRHYDREVPTDRANGGPLRCCDDGVEVSGITEDGRMVISRSSRNQVWVWTFLSHTAQTTPLEAPLHRLTGVPASTWVTQVGDRDMLVLLNGGDYSLVPVPSEGRFEPGVSFAGAIDANLGDPLDKRVLVVGGSGEIAVITVPDTQDSDEPFERVTLRTPFIDYVQGLRWESADSVLFFGSQGETTYLLRCRTDVGSCELAGVPEAEQLLSR